MLGTAISRTLDKTKFNILDVKGYASYRNGWHQHNGKIVKDPELDITDWRLVQRFFNHKMKPNDIVIHCAAYAGTDKCDDFSYEAVKSNVLGTQHLVEACRLRSCRMVYFSTTATQDPDKYMEFGGHFDESAESNPKTLYGLSKYCGELAVNQGMQKEDQVVIKPVFIYGDAPWDNASILRKILEKAWWNRKTKVVAIAKLPVLLDVNYRKDYTYWLHFGDMFSCLMNREWGDICGRDYILSRNDPKPFQHYLDVMSEVIEDDVMRYIELFPEDDYLKDHNGLPNNFYDVCPGYVMVPGAYNDKFNLRKVWTSIKELGV